MIPLTVLSHNVFWFQGFPFPTDTPPAADEDILKRLCSIYRAATPDVICLQEVQSLATFDRLSELLEMPGCYCAGATLPQYGGAVFWQPDIAHPICSSEGEPLKTQRMWQVVEVESGIHRLRICNVHLPSSRQLGPEGGAVQRMAELQDVIRSCETGPDIIVGDFNEQPGGGTNTFMQRHGYGDVAMLSNGASDSTTVVEGRGDYAWIKRSIGDDLLTYAVVGKEDLACHDIHKQYLSDHLPLWFTLKEH